MLTRNFLGFDSHRCKLLISDPKLEFSGFNVSEVCWKQAIFLPSDLMTLIEY